MAACSFSVAPDFDTLCEELFESRHQIQTSHQPGLLEKIQTLKVGLRTKKKWRLTLFVFVSGPFLNLFLSDLSEPVDVYSDWIDACEAANQ